MSQMHNMLIKKLQNSLKKMGRKALWSYDLAHIPKRLPDKVIIEKILLFGNSADWNLLKQVYSEELIKNVWLENMVLGGFNPKRQEEIARNFFHIKEPQSFLSQYQNNHINNLLEGGL